MINLEDSQIQIPIGTLRTGGVDADFILVVWAKGRASIHVHAVGKYSKRDRVFFTMGQDELESLKKIVADLDAAVTQLKGEGKIINLIEYIA